MKKLRKSRLLGTRPDHVRVESSSCCFPRELVSLVLPRELASLANGTRHILLQSEITVRRSPRMYQYKEVTTLKGTFTYVSSNSCSTFVDNRGPRNPISIWRSGCIIRSVPLIDKTKQHQLKWRSSLAMELQWHHICGCLQFSTESFFQQVVLSVPVDTYLYSLIHVNRLMHSLESSLSSRTNFSSYKVNTTQKACMYGIM